MTLKELFSEWRNPKELLKAALFTGLFFVVSNIYMLVNVDIHNREVLLWGSFVIAVINVVTIGLTYRIIINKK